ncbi:carboxypeptidase-like regulatory domain-containing protein [Catellatospora sp. NPDC049609]|uniref:carboxypeptidase-like regulatory domain-containing protein n=1 Tax=Catellatospora sp. NPDC049609 TaxID=3155505 RepID=UPI00341F0A1A
MRRGALTALAVLAAALIIPSPSAQGAPAQTAPAPAQVAPTAMSNITGKITDAATGQPIAGACVTAMRNVGQTMGQVCTGADGRYRFDGIYDFGVYLRAAVGTTTWWWPGSLDPVYATTVAAYPGVAPVADFVVERRQGTFRGSLTRQDGSPAIFATAALYPVGADKAITFTTALDGTFQRTGVPAGRYHVAFNGSGYATQWYPAKATRAEATPVEITEDGAVEIVEQFRAVDPTPVGPALVTVHGVVTAEPDGTPVAGAQVSLHGSRLEPFGTVRTDSTGRFAFPDIRQGIGIQVKVSAPGFATTWLLDNPEPTSTSFASTTPLAFRLRPGAGRLTVVVKDDDGTQAPPGITATLSTVDGSWTYALPLRFDGTIDLAEVPAGRYRLRLDPRALAGLPVRPTQWYPSSPDSAGAGVITIRDGETTVVTESMLRPATIEVTLRDGLTGAPISGACVQMWREVCTDVDGVYRTELDYQTGPYTISATHAPTHFPAQTSVVAKVGEVTKVTLTMQPGAVIATTYRDGAINPDPENPDPVCVYGVRGRWGAESVTGVGTPVCGMPAADGTLRLGPFPSGWVQLFVLPREAAGAQWLGYRGGTGDRRTAAVINLTAGAVTNAPWIVPAAAGSVRAVVRNVDTGERLDRVCLEAGPGLGGCGAQQEDGYTLDGLGPYQWTLSYGGSSGHLWAPTGSPGTPPSVPIVSGKTVVADARLTSGTLVQSVHFGGPAEPSAWHVEVFDAWTGVLRYSASGNSSLFLPSSQPVAIRMTYGGKRCWAHFTSGRRLTPYYTAGTGVIVNLTLTPEANCLPGEPPRLPAPIRGTKGPVVVTMFDPLPTVRGGAPTVAGMAAAPSVTGTTATSPWGRPTAGMMARVKP